MNSKSIVPCRKHQLPKNLVCIEEDCQAAKLICDSCFYEDHSDHKTLHFYSLLQHLQNINISEDENQSKMKLTSLYKELNSTRLEILNELKSLEQIMSVIEDDLKTPSSNYSEGWTFLGDEKERLLRFFNDRSMDDRFTSLNIEDIDAVGDLVDSIVKKKLKIVSAREIPKIRPYVAPYVDWMKSQEKYFKDLKRILTSNNKSFGEALDKALKNGKRKHEQAASCELEQEMKTSKTLENRRVLRVKQPPNNEKNDENCIFGDSVTKRRILNL